MEPRESALGEELEELDNSEHESGDAGDDEVEEVSNTRTNGDAHANGEQAERSDEEMDGD